MGVTITYQFVISPYQSQVVNSRYRDEQTACRGIFHVWPRSCRHWAYTELIEANANIDYCKDCVIVPDLPAVKLRRLIFPSYCLFPLLLGDDTALVMLYDWTQKVASESKS